MDERARLSTVQTLDPDPQTEQGMQAVPEDGKLADMGRMDGRWPSSEKNLSVGSEGCRAGANQRGRVDTKSVGLHVQRFCSLAGANAFGEPVCEEAEDSKPAQLAKGDWRLGPLILNGNSRHDQF